MIKTHNENLNTNAIKFSAPGSCMLLGEHAVLHNEPAIVAAINKRINVKLITRTDDIINISSDMGKYTTDIKNIKPTEPFLFVTTAIELFKNKILHGFDLIISAEFNALTGLGSSAAVTVATLAAIFRLINLKLDLQKLHRASLNVIHKVQGIASGADAAASIFGGTIFYKYKPKIYIEKLKCNPPISLIYSGYKTKTADVINVINSYIKNSPKKYSDLFKKIGALTCFAKNFINENNLPELAKIFCNSYLLQKELGISDTVLNNIIDATKNIKEIYAAKISGSGLGDCVITLGVLLKNFNINNLNLQTNNQTNNFLQNCNIRKIDVAITDAGLKNESS